MELPSSLPEFKLSLNQNFHLHKQKLKQICYMFLHINYRKAQFIDIIAHSSTIILPKPHSKYLDRKRKDQGTREWKEGNENKFTY